VALLRELAKDLAFGIISLRDRQSLLAATGELRDAERQLRRQFAQLQQKQGDLLQSEERYRNLVEMSPYGIIVHCQGLVVFANPAAVRLSGARNAQQLIGRPAIEFVHPDSRARALQRIREIGRHKVEAPLEEERFVRIDGTAFDVEVVASPLVYHDQPSIQVMFRDISERKRLDEQLRSRERSYHELADSLPQTVFEMDRDGRVLYANSTAFEQFGYRGADIARGINVLDLLLPQDRERARANIERRLSGRLSEHQEYTAVRRDGTTFPINIYARTIMRDGRAAGLRGVIVDITARKRIEGSLSESEAKFRALAETSPSGIFVYRETFLYVNPACEELTGYSRGELLKLKFWDIVHPDFRALIRQRGLARQRGDAVPSHYEFKILRKDGQERWVDFAATAVTYEGAPAGMGTVFDVTEKKQAEQLLTQSEEFNRSIIENSPVAIAVRDRSGRLVSYNRAWERLWALPPAAIAEMQKPMTPALLRQHYAYIPDHVPAIIDLFQRGGTLLIPEIRIDRPRPGQAQWIRQQFYTIMDPAGRLDRIVVLTEDITVRKEAETQLQKSRMQYQTLSRMSPVGIFQTDADGRTVYVNPRWCEIAGVPLAAAMADDWLDVVHPDDRERVVAGWQEAVRNRRPSASEYRFRRPDGTVRWVMGQAVPELSGDGTVLGYVGTITDITERKLIEQALSDSERKYRQIFDGIVEGIFQSSPGGELLTANPALIKMLGYDSLEELQGINIERDGYVDADNRKRFLQQLNEHGEVWDFQSRWRRKDGTIIIISENARLVRDRRGQPLYYEGTVEDITEHVNADMALLDEKEKLSQLFEVSLSVARAGSIQQQLDLTIKGLADLRLFRRMVIIVKDAEGRNAHLAQFGLDPREVELVRRAPPASERARALIFDPRHRISNSYFIPHDADEAIKQATAVLDSSDTIAGEWHPRDNLTVPLVVKGKFIGYISADEPVDGRIPSMETVRLLELYANQAAIAVENLHLYNDLERSYYDTLKAFVAAMEAKDPYTKGHSENVRHYALKLAQFMGLPPDRIRLIDYSSLLHDIGKLGVKEQILSKTSLLSPLEYEEVKQHPVIGSQMVSAIENLSSTAPIIHSHHEFYDGSGYPGGIKGDQIPLESRIISVADAFEAMTSDRPYRKAFSFREALLRLEQASGTQFDREIVSAFVAMAAQEGTDAAHE